MGDREELESLRRLDELEKRAAPAASYTPPKRPDIGAPPTGISIDTWRGMPPEQRAAMQDQASRPWGSGVPKLAYDVGGTVTDATGSPGAGMAANMATNAIPAFASSFSVPGATSLMQKPAEMLMRKAIKPSTTDDPAKVAQALRTALDEGLNPSYGGMSKASEISRSMNPEIDAAVKASIESVPLSSIESRLGGLIQRKQMQTNSQADLDAIQAELEAFRNNPLVQRHTSGLRDEQTLLREALEKAKSGRISALQDAGRFQTFSAQQENLAHGGKINLSPSQPRGEPFFNVGPRGGEASSPSAFPVPGMPRIAGRYSENVQRVPEGVSAAEDALRIAAQRGDEAKSAELALAAAMGKEPSIPVALAHELKKGTYESIGSKAYGEMASTSTEAQKQLARGMREAVMEKVPSVQAPLARQADLNNWRDIVGNAAAREGNKDLLGISVAASNPQTMAASLLDRLGIAKAMAARTLYTAGKPAVANPINIAAGAYQNTDKQRMAEYLRKRAEQ